MKNVLILGAGGQIARHVINQLADKQTIKQTLFARQPAKSTNPIQLIARLLWGCTESCSTEAGHAGTGCCVCQPYGEDLDIQANSVIAAMKACDVKRLIFVLSLGIYDEVQENLANGIMQLLVNPKTIPQGCGCN